MIILSWLGITLQYDYHQYNNYITINATINTISQLYTFVCVCVRKLYTATEVCKRE